MVENRIREFFRSTPAGAAFANPAARAHSFMPCPVFQTFSPAQQTAILEIYRIAAERTRDQLQPRRTARYFEPSLN
jgi:hypothetical protein